MGLPHQSVYVGEISELVLEKVGSVRLGVQYLSSISLFFHEVKESSFWLRVKHIDNIYIRHQVQH
jgi:hypothetical protein